MTRQQGGYCFEQAALLLGMLRTLGFQARPLLVRAGEHGWMLQRDAGAGWKRQYSFTTDKVWPADLEAANHWTATRPDTRFTTLRIVSGTLPDGFVSLTGRALTVTRRGAAEAREIGSTEEYRRVLDETFGLKLSAEEVDALGLF